jgi:hypothetical protein
MKAPAKDLVGLLRRLDKRSVSSKKQRRDRQGIGAEAGSMVVG